MITVAGLQYHNIERIPPSKIVLGCAVALRREPNNAADPNALAVYIDATKVGYVARAVNRLVNPDLTWQVSDCFRFDGAWCSLEIMSSDNKEL